MASVLKPAESGQSSSPSSSRRPIYPQVFPPGKAGDEMALMDAARNVRRFGAEIRRRRIALGLRLIDLAPRAHVSPNYIGKIEHGHGGTDPSLGVAMSIARGLGTDLQDLLGGFHLLTPLGIEAGRIFDALPARLQSTAMGFLRALDGVVNGKGNGAAATRR